MTSSRPFRPTTRLIAALWCGALLTIALTANAPPATAQPALPDTFFTLDNGFDRSGGSCATSGWLGENRVPVVYAHVSDRFVVNSPFYGGVPSPSANIVFTGLAATSKLSVPKTSAIDAAGNVVFSDFSPSGFIAVYEAAPGGALTTFATFTSPTVVLRYMTRDPLNGQIVCSTNEGLYRIPAAGGTPVFWGGGGGEVADTTLAETDLHSISQISFDDLGNLYCADGAAHVIRKVRPDLRVVRVAGLPFSPGYTGDGGGALAARLNGPRGVCVAGSTLYIGDESNRVVRAVDLTSGIITTATTTPAVLPSYIVNAGGTVYVRGPQNFYKLVGTTLEPVAGTVDLFDYFTTTADSLKATELRINGPEGLTATATGGFVFCANRMIYQVSSGGTLGWVAGQIDRVVMGERALWFGADDLSAPGEVAGWVTNHGFGNGWSQRLTSPAFSYTPGTDIVKMSFDVVLELGSDNGVSFSGTKNEYAVVEGHRAADNQWLAVVTRPTFYAGAVSPMSRMAGREAFHVDLDLSVDGNPTLGQFDRFRIRMQSDRLASNEDGRQVGTMGGALIDNLQVLKNGAALLPLVTFEDGTTGGWTLSAFNGAYELGAVTPFFTRDFTLPTTGVQTRSGVDSSDPSCVWTFTGTNGTQERGTFARISSPWFAGIPASTTAYISFSGKLNTSDQKSVLAVWVRGRYAGHAQPDLVGPTFARFNSGTTGSDAFAPFINQRTLVFPTDFDVDQAYVAAHGVPDSLQLVFQVEDIRDAVSGSATNLPSAWPYLDDIRVSFSGVDPDHDGVAIGRDLCPSVSGYGQDADSDGCPDTYASLHHVRTWAMADRPIHYRVSQDGDPTVSDGSDLNALTAGFDAWALVNGAAVPVVQDPLTTQKDASPFDGVNLMTFQDPDQVFPPSVLAVTSVTTLVHQGAYNDRIVMPGQIVDSDMLLNPGVLWKTLTHPGTFDLQSVATHEAGHFLGLSHSAVLDATMFYVIQPSRDAVSLENDDQAAISAAYPSSDLGLEYGEIRGTIQRGSNGNPIPGALVSAIMLDPGGAPVDTVATDYSDASGAYGLFHLLPGDYAVRVDPLDGAAGGLTASRVNDRVAAIAETNFEGEWWSAPESDRDDPNIHTLIPVTAGAHLTGYAILTNIDTIPPAVVAVTPANASTDVGIDAVVTLQFSEDISIPSLQVAFRLHTVGDSTRIAGNGQLIDGTRLVFAPAQPLDFGTAYQLDITTDLTDAQDVHLLAPFSSQFTTQARPPVAISNIQPSSVPPNALITITGSGFDPAIAPRTVEFAGEVVFAVPEILSSTSMIVRVPTYALTGPVVYHQGSETSNPFAITVLPPPAQASPAAFGSPVTLDFAPTDVALSPDGLTAYTVGAGGFATVDLAGAPRVAIKRSTVAADAVTLTPDGNRALITRRLAGTLDIVDAQPGSGTFGQSLKTINGFAAPTGVVSSSDGRRAFVTDGNGQVKEIDLSAGTSQYTILRATALAGTLTGGIAFDALPSGYVVGIASQGMRWVKAASDSTTLSVPLQNPASPTGIYPNGGIAVSPNALEVLGAGPASAGRLAFATLSDSGSVAVMVTNGSLPIGGSPADVAITREGQSAFVANTAFNELDIVNLDPTSATYHSKVGQITTGVGPVAVAVSPLSNIIAVANGSGRTLSIFSYSTSGSNAIQTVDPAVARPGDMVAVRGNGTGFTTGTQVDLGSGLITADHAVGSGAAFKLPAQGQREASVTLQTPAGERSLALPLTVVDPILSFQPRATSLTSLLPSYACSGDEGAGLPRTALSSPDGRMMAIGLQFPSGDCSNIELFSTSAEGSDVLGSPRAVISSFPVFTDMAFTPDSKQLWTARTGHAGLRYDTDPSSPTFGSTLGGMPTSPESVAPDPLGRFMLVSGSVVGSPGFTVRADPVTAAAKDTLEALVHDKMVVSPDGRWFIASTYFTSLQIRDLDNLASAPIVTPTHGGDSFTHLMCSPDGRRVVGRTAAGHIGVWNLDASSAPIGYEFFFGDPVPGLTLKELARGATSTSMLALGANSAELVRLDVTGGNPIPTLALIDTPAQLLTASPDGRRLWVGRSNIHPGTGIPGQVYDIAMSLISLSEASHLSLVSGDQQSGTPGTALPIPLRVKVTDPGGRPQEGVAVRFESVIGPAGGLIVKFDGVPRSFLERITDANGEASVSMTLPTSIADVPISVTAYGVLADVLHLVAHSVPGNAQIEPVVERIGPPTGSSGINAGSAVFVAFNQSMQLATVESRLTLTANGNSVAGAFSTSDRDRFVSFQPAAALPFDATCVLTMASGALDSDGQVLALGASVTFTVQPVPTLRLSSLSPPAGPAGAPVTLLGAGFNTTASGDIVAFNGVLAPVTGAAGLELNTRVPIGATTGPVTVQVGGTTSDPITFTVLVANGTPGSVVSNLPTGAGAREVVVTPDGSRAYVSNPTTNDVTALQISGGSVITRVPVGLSPLGLAVLPSGKRLYVANTGSDNVSVIDVDPTSPSYHTVVKTIGVGDQPVAVAIAAQSTGMKVVVLNGADGTLSILDAEPGNASYDEVTSTASAGSSTRGGGVVVSQDGGLAWVGATVGVVSVDLHTGGNTTIATPSAVSDVALTPDGSLVLALLENGTLLVIGAQPGTSGFNQVTATASAGSSTRGGSVVVSQDGGLAYVTLPDGNTVIVFSIGTSTGNPVVATPSKDPSVAPGPAVTLHLIKSIPVGQSPAGLAADPNGRFTVAVNSGSGTLSVIGLPNAIDAVVCRFDFDPGTLNVKSLGKWVTTHITPPAPFTPEQIDISSLRVEGVVPVEPGAHATYGDYDSDGHPDLTIKFPRAPVSLLLPEGDSVHVHLSGQIATRALAGLDTIRVIRAGIWRPTAGMLFQPGAEECVSWEIPGGTEHRLVALLYSLDKGTTWNLIGNNLTNKGYIFWSVPGVTCDSALIAVVFVQYGDVMLGDFRGVLGISDYFTIGSGALGLDNAPVALQFAPIVPNPSRDAVSMRFGLPKSTDVTLEVFDVQGRRVRTLIKGIRPPGWTRVAWDAKDGNGNPAGSGIYFARFRADGRTFEQRLTLLR